VKVLSVRFPRACFMTRSILSFDNYGSPIGTVGGDVLCLTCHIPRRFCCLGLLVVAFSRNLSGGCVSWDLLTLSPPMRFCRVIGSPPDSQFSVVNYSCYPFPIISCFFYSCQRPPESLTYIIYPPSHPIVPKYYPVSFPSSPSLLRQNVYLPSQKDAPYFSCSGLFELRRSIKMDYVVLSPLPCESQLSFYIPPT